MADVDEQPQPQPQPQSIAQRIAALKLGQGSPVPSHTPPSYSQATNTTTPTPTTGRARPPPPPRPTLPARPASTSLPAQNGTNGQVGNLPEGPPDQRPALPARTSTSSQSAKSPALPPRRPSESPALPARRPSAAPSSSTDSRRPSSHSLSRRSSNESMSSITTSRSATSQSDRYAVKAPPYDPASLPPLPPKRTQEEREADLRRYANVGTGPGKRKSMPGLLAKASGTTAPPVPSVPVRPVARVMPAKVREVGSPPALPSRGSAVQVETARSTPVPAREMVPPPPARKAAFTTGVNGAANAAPPVPGRPMSVPQTDGAGPPPVPKSSRPDLAALQASKPKINGTSTSSTTAATAAAAPSNACLRCRDFSAPDNHAARFPRESIPSQDLGWLANQLTSPFPSHTDKARALFTWLHHNIAYDTVALFTNNVKPSTPASTLASGLAVCEGYAGLFAAMAMKCGLEAYVVSGDGKGLGHTDYQPGTPIPPVTSNHAWNVVRIDNSEWKLIDCCWGAGHAKGWGQPYEKSFSPERFTQSNDEFGLDHYPSDSSKQFRNDGRVVSWEEYFTTSKNGCGALVYSGWNKEGIDTTSFRPFEGKISVSHLPGPTVRFQFQKLCPHWEPTRNGMGPAYLYVLDLGGLEGTRTNYPPFETDGNVWWCDVPVRDLGAPGGKAQICTLAKFDGQEGRGLPIQTYREKKGRVGMEFAGVVCKWEIGA